MNLILLIINIYNIIFYLKLYMNYYLKLKKIH